MIRMYQVFQLFFHRTIFEILSNSTTIETNSTSSPTVSTLAGFNGAAIMWAGTILVGILTSIASVYIWEFLRKPALGFKVGGRIEQDFGNNGKRAIFHIEIRNHGKDMATACIARITFRDCNNLELFSVSGKWSRGPEPLIPTVIQQGQSARVGSIPWPSLIPFTETLDLRPGVSEPIGLVLKFEGEDECYPFSSWSYVEGAASFMRVAKWRIPIGRFYAQVQIEGGNVKETALFQVDNKGKSFSDVEIKCLSDLPKNAKVETKAQRPSNSIISPIREIDKSPNLKIIEILVALGGFLGIIIALQTPKGVMLTDYFVTFLIGLILSALYAYVALIQGGRRIFVKAYVALFSGFFSGLLTVLLAQSIASPILEIAVIGKTVSALIEALMLYFVIAFAFFVMLYLTLIRVLMKDYSSL